MHTPCPHCESPLAAASVGFMCTNCGRLYRYAEPDELIDEHGSQNMNDAHGTSHAATNFNQSQTHQVDLDSITDTDSTKHSDSSEQRPQIINHRASSHYRRRLHERIHSLETPELEPPDDLRSYASSDEQTADYHQEQVEAAAVGSAAAGTAFTHEYQSHEPHQKAEQSEPTAQNTDDSATEEELWGPHKPSPHVLDVASSKPEESDNELMPGSPLDLRDIDTDHAASQKSTPSLSSSSHPHDLSSPPIHTQSRNQLIKDTDALAKADALLAAASTPAPNKNSANLIWLGITAVIVVALASFLAFFLLKPPAPQQSASPSPSTVTSQSPTSTQSASAKRDAQRKSDLNDIAVGLSAYQKATGKYPIGNDISVLQPLTTANPPFIKTISNDPKNDPANGVIIKYSYTSDGTTYTLAASLENKNDPDAKNGLYIVKSSTN